MLVQASLPRGSKLHSIARRRLQEMSDHRFVRLQASKDMVVVGSESDPWTAAEMTSALERVREMASDPAKGNKINSAAIEEAAVALTAENLHVFESLNRETTGGAEFVDSDGQTWDVKSPVSVPEGQNWYFSPHHHLKKVRKDFANGDHVLLNLSRVNATDRDSTLSLLNQELTVSERNQLLILTDAV